MKNNDNLYSILKTVAGNIIDHKPNIQMFENQ